MFLTHITKRIVEISSSSVVVDLLVHTAFIVILVCTVPYLCSISYSVLNRKRHSTEPPWLPSRIPCKYTPVIRRVEANKSYVVLG
jgi:hypothetical protein